MTLARILAPNSGWRIRACAWLGLASLIMAQPAARAADPALRGCWQSLHVATRLANGRINHVHNNCAVAFGQGTMKTDCQFPKGGHYTSESKWASTQAGELTLTLVQSNSNVKQPLGARTFEYLIEGDYLVIRETLSPAKDAPEDAPVEITRVFLKRPALGEPQATTDAALCSSLAP